MEPTLTCHRIHAHGLSLTHQSFYYLAWFCLLTFCKYVPYVVASRSYFSSVNNSIAIYGIHSFVQLLPIWLTVLMPDWSTLSLINSAIHSFTHVYTYKIIGFNVYISISENVNTGWVFIKCLKGWDYKRILSSVS